MLNLYKRKVRKDFVDMYPEIDVMELFEKYIDSFRMHIMEPFINTTPGIIILSIIILVVIFRIAKKVMMLIHYKIKQLIKKIAKAITKIQVIKKEDPVIEIQREFLSAPLINKRDFLWFFQIFRLEKSKAAILLIKSSIIFLLHPKYLKKYFCKSIIGDSSTTERLDNSLSLAIKSFVAKPNEVTYAEIIIKNLGDTAIYFNTAKGKQKGIFRLNLYSKGKLRHEQVTSESIDSIQYLLNGILPPQEERTINVYFQKIDEKTIKEIESISISGSLKFKGPGGYKNYEMVMDLIKNAEEEGVEKKLLPMLEYNVWKDIFEQGGLSCFVTMFSSLLFFVSIIINNIYFQLFLWLVALLLSIIAVPLNVAITRFVSEFNAAIDIKQDTPQGPASHRTL